jgi:hypothetical protein
MKSENPVILVVEDEVLVRMVAVSVAERKRLRGALGRDCGRGDRHPRNSIGYSAGLYGRAYAWIDGRTEASSRGSWSMAACRLLVTSALGNVTAKDLPERGRFLPKPYNAATLSRVLQQMAGD